MAIDFDAVGTVGGALGLGGAQATQPDHPFTGTPSGAAGRQPRPGGLPAASSQTASDDPLNTAGSVLARDATGENNSFLHNGPWSAVVMESFTAENPRQPPDTTGQNQRPVPWIVAYVPSDSSTPHSPHAMLMSPITNRRDGTQEEQRIHWQAINHLFQIGHFIRRDGDPQGHLPQQNDRVNVTFHDARNPSKGGYYETVAHSGYQNPTAIPSVPECEPVVLEVTTPSGASGNQAYRSRTITQPTAPLAAAGELALPFHNIVSSGFHRGRGARIHGSVDMIGPDDAGFGLGLGDAIYSMAKARITRIRECCRPGAECSSSHLRSYSRYITAAGQSIRGGRSYPNFAEIPGYGRVYFFSETGGTSKTGTYIQAEGIEGLLEGYTFRYMHLAAVHPSLTEGSIVQAGQEIGLMGSTAVQESRPHLHMDITRPGESPTDHENRETSRVDPENCPDIVEGGNLLDAAEELSGTYRPTTRRV